MFKQLKAVTALGAMTVALMASAPASAQSLEDLGAMFWSQNMMVKMDRNKDGMVSRQEFMDYMGRQFDIMDTKKKGMLNKAEFTDKKMMSSTFPSAGKE